MIDVPVTRLYDVQDVYLTMLLRSRLFLMVHVLLNQVDLNINNECSKLQWEGILECFPLSFCLSGPY